MTSRQQTALVGLVLLTLAGALTSWLNAHGFGWLAPVVEHAADEVRAEAQADTDDTDHDSPEAP